MHAACNMETHMWIQNDQDHPFVDPSARVASTAVISGDVHIGANCSIGHGAVLISEGGPIRIGDNCVIMDTAVIRGVPGHVTQIGSCVLVGPHAYLVGCSVEDEVFIATGAAVFNGAILRRGSEVRIHAVVHIRTELAAHATVPIGWVAVGTPAQIFLLGITKGSGPFRSRSTSRVTCSTRNVPRRGNP